LPLPSLRGEGALERVGGQNTSKFCTTKRLFKQLIENYLRTTSGQSRAVYLARLNIESKLAQEVEYDDIIKTFVEKNVRKVFLKQP